MVDPISGIGDGGGLGDMPTGGGGNDIDTIGNGIDAGVAECNALWDSLSASVTVAVRQCLNECNGTIDNCVRCVAGVMESAYPELDAKMEKCLARLTTVVAADLDYIRSVAVSVGLPPTIGDDTSVSEGLVKPLGVVGGIADEPGGTTPPSGNTPDTLVGGGAGTPTYPSQPPDINQPAAAGGCFTADWLATDIIRWATNVYGAGTPIQLPSEGTSGLWRNNRGFTYRIPPYCVTTAGASGSGAPSPNPGTGGGASPVPVPGGGAGQSPPAGSGGTGGPAGSGTTPPASGDACDPSSNRTLAYDESRDAVPGDPVVIVSPGCPCPEGYSETGTETRGDQHGGRYQVKVCSLGQATLAGGNGNDTCPCPAKPESTLPMPLQPSHLFCDPATLPDSAKLAGAANKIGTKPPESKDESLSGIILSELRRALTPSFLLGLTGNANGPDSVAGGVISGIFSALTNVLAPIINSGPCTSAEFGVYTAVNAIPSLLSQWLHALPQQYSQTNEYVLNYLCPYLIPDVGAADRLYNDGWIDSTQWQTLVQANGVCPDWQLLLRQDAETRPDVSSLIGMVRRDLLPADQVESLWRRNGVVDPQYREAFFRLADYVPGPGDLVHFMQRDVFDPNVVGKYGLDEEFTSKYQGKVIDWAKAQGMDAETFKYYWRSHWQYASPGQIYEMVHRLRTNDRSPTDPYRDITFTIDDAREALRVQDIAPYFVDRLLATSYRSVSQRLLIRGIQGGEYGADDVRRVLLDEGYRPDDAEKLARAIIRTYGPQIAKAAGFTPAATVLQWYRELAINRGEAVARLQDAGLTEQQANQSIDAADSRVNADRRRSAAKSYKRRYMSGEFRDDEIAAALVSSGIDVDRVNDLVRGWRIEREAKYKAPTVSMLCGWYTRGLITLDEYYQRVINLNYSVTDASRIVQTCVGDDKTRRAKEVDKQAKALQAAQRKQLADQKKAAADARAAAKNAKADYLASLPCKPPPKPQCPPETPNP